MIGFNDQILIMINGVNLYKDKKTASKIPVFFTSVVQTRLETVFSGSSKINSPGFVPT
jgi:hypothetical protein